MKKFKFTINGNQYETEVLSIEDNIAEIEVNGTIYSVEVNRDIKPTKTPKLVQVCGSSIDRYGSFPGKNQPSGCTQRGRKY